MIKEYRIPLPLTVEEYQIGQLYSVIETSKNETGGGEGVEIVLNEPFNNEPFLGGKYNCGQYTNKIYHLKRKVPTIIKLMAPRGALVLNEESWNAYPFCRTVLTNPSYMKSNFLVVFDSFHVAGKGEEFNPLELSPELLEKREIVRIDVANDPIPLCDYNEKYDPTKFHSKKTNKGPYIGDWIGQEKSMMTCYKYLSVEFKWFGLQNRIEAFMHRMAQRVLTVFHRQVLCSIDEWIDLSIADIRKMEEKIKEDLNKQRRCEGFRGSNLAEGM